ncbi:winged helix-turn-helix transcriptional regulator [Sinorhizobium fredii]|uniref:winged helix-turn-helix transcriptional regulator n=1 Tax=Rhizobium fredii TaxID=380 RepID=UPI00351559C8
MTEGEQGIDRMKAQHAKPLVLICSDDADFYVLLAHILVREGFEAALVGEDEVIKRAATRHVTAIILDSAKDPGLTLKTCAVIKASHATAGVPTIALVSSGDERYYLALLKAGIDENFFRPVSPARLLAYLCSLSRSDANGTRPTGAIGGGATIFGGLRIEAGRRMVVYGDKEIQLGPIEFNLLRCLVEKPGRVFSRLELIETAWPSGLFVQPRTVDVHVGRLRRSLERLSGRSMIRTVRATGYALDMDARWD